MSEKTLQEGLQTDIRTLADFANEDVVINDWQVLDQPTERGPYVIIENANEFIWRQDTSAKNTQWSIAITLAEPFVTDWGTTLNNFRDSRQALRDQLIGSTLSASGLTGVTIDVVRNEGNAEPYGPIERDELGELIIIPHFWVQRIVLEGEEF